MTPSGLSDRRSRVSTNRSTAQRGGGSLERTYLVSSGSSLMLSAINRQCGYARTEQHRQDAVNSRSSGAHSFYAAARPTHHVVGEVNDNSRARPNHTSQSDEEQKCGQNQSANLDGRELLHALDRQLPCWFVPNASMDEQIRQRSLGIGEHPPPLFDQPIKSSGTRDDFADDVLHAFDVEARKIQHAIIARIRDEADVVA